MYFKKLEYMMSNDSNKTISQKGSDIRKKIRPTFINFLKLGNKLKLVIEKNEYKKVDRPVIYVASHAFKDDVLNTILTNRDNTYVVFGNIDLFYHTLDGLCLWIYGAQLVDRYDKESRHAMKDKMNKILEYGNNELIFPEATWNMSENLLMLPFHWGFYDAAKANNALIVPTITYKVGKKCYSRQLSPIDINEVTNDDINLTVNLMRKFANKAYDVMLYSDTKSKKIREWIQDLQHFIDEYEKNLSDYNLRNITTLAHDVSIYAKVNIDFIDEELKAESYKLVSMLLSRVSTSLKEAQVFRIRDIMAKEKYELYEKHPDYSYMKNGKDMYEAWDDYIKDTVNGTPYFYVEPEATTVFKDPLVQNIDEVMPWLDSKTYMKRK